MAETQTKVCTTCKIEKSIDCFYRKGKYFVSQCKKCTLERVKNYQTNLPIDKKEQRKKYMSEYVKTNKDLLNKRKREWNKIKRINDKEWYKKQLKAAAEYKRKRRITNSENIRKYFNNYWEQLPDAAIRTYCKRLLGYKEEDINENLIEQIRSSILRKRILKTIDEKSDLTVCISCYNVFNKSQMAKTSNGAKLHKCIPCMKEYKKQHHLKTKKQKS